MRIALSVWGSSPTAAMRFSVSRQERPASTSRRVLELATMAQLPLLPLASTVILTHMGASIAVSRDLRE